MLQAVSSWFLSLADAPRFTDGLVPHASTIIPGLKSDASPAATSAGGDLCYSDQCREVATTTSQCVTELEGSDPGRLVKRCQHLHEVFKVCGSR